MEKIEAISKPDQTDIRAWIITTQALGLIEMLWADEKGKPKGKRARVLGRAFESINAILDLYPNGSRFDLIRLGDKCGQVAEAALNEAIGTGLVRYGHEVYVQPTPRFGTRNRNYGAVLSTVSAVCQAMADGRTENEINIAAKCQSGPGGATARAIVALQKALLMKDDLPEIKKCNHCGTFFERRKKEGVERFAARRFCGTKCSNDSRTKDAENV